MRVENGWGLGNYLNFQVIEDSGHRGFRLERFINNTGVIIWLIELHPEFPEKLHGEIFCVSLGFINGNEVEA